LFFKIRIIMKKNHLHFFFLLTLGFYFPASAQTPTWSEDVAPIVFNHCTSCHRPGEIAPFPLTNYTEAYNWANMIQYVTEIRYMPPWKADPNFGVEYLGENYLTDEEILTIKEWVDGGAPQGDLNLEPPLPVFPTGSQVGTPDLVLSFNESYVHEGNGTDEYRWFVLPTGLTEDKNLVALEMRPGNTEIVHHALFWADSSGTAAALDAQTPEYGFKSSEVQGGGQGDYGQQLPAFVPGAKPNLYSHGMAQRVFAGSDLVMQVHYAPTASDEPDSSTVNLFFADEPITRQVRNHIMLPNTLVNGPFVMEPETVTEFHGVFTVPLNVSLLGVMPHSHLLGKNWRVFAVTPQNDTIPLIHIEDWDFNWQGTYYFRNLAVLPTGTEIHAFATYDNTSDNPFNPNFPPQTVTWGEKTSDEMFYLPLIWVPYLPGDEDIDLGNDITTGSNEVVFHFNQTQLYPVNPNPAKGLVKLGFTLAETSLASVTVFDQQGRQVAKPKPDKLTLSGEHILNWDTSLHSPGIYFVTLQANGTVHTQKVVVIP
jgi:hypothetical protein